jgi:hypothetical protein
VCASAGIVRGDAPGSVNGDARANRRRYVRIKPLRQPSRHDAARALEKGAHHQQTPVAHRHELLIARRRRRPADLAQVAIGQQVGRLPANAVGQAPQRDLHFRGLGISAQHAQAEAVAGERVMHGGVERGKIAQAQTQRHRASPPAALPVDDAKPKAGTFTRG